jgi:hypothetical protein
MHVYRYISNHTEYIDIQTAPMHVLIDKNSFVVIVAIGKKPEDISMVIESGY